MYYSAFFSMQIRISCKIYKDLYNILTYFTDNSNVRTSKIFMAEKFSCI